MKEKELTDEQAKCLLEAIFREEEDTELLTYTDKAVSAACDLTGTMEYLGKAIWNLERLHGMLLVGEKDGRPTLPDIIINNIAGHALKSLLVVQNDIDEAVELITEVYNDTKGSSKTNEKES